MVLGGAAPDGFPVTPGAVQVAYPVQGTGIDAYLTLAAPLLYVGTNQVNCIVPAGVSGLDTVTVQLVTPQGQTAGPTLFLEPSQPAIFHTRQGSPFLADYALALNQDQTVNAASNPATPGSVLSIWVSGSGPDGVSPPDGTIRPNQPIEGPRFPVSVLGGRRSLEVLYAGDAPGSVYGLVQVKFPATRIVFRGVHNFRDRTASGRERQRAR